MNWRDRKVRIAIVLAIAAFALFYAWRTGTAEPGNTACVPGREEVKDAGGKVIEIKRTTCTEG
jgi:hypothetical protein